MNRTPEKTNDVWERLRHVTFDEFVTYIKMHGSAGAVHGFTTPEGWPFSIVLAVASPGNERAVELLHQYVQRMDELTHSLRVNREAG